MGYCDTCAMPWCNPYCPHRDEWDNSSVVVDDNEDDTSLFSSTEEYEKD
jgi:hypothetical protein